MIARRELPRPGGRVRSRRPTGRGGSAGRTTGRRRSRHRPCDRSAGARPRHYSPRNSAWWGHPSARTGHVRERGPVAAVVGNDLDGKTDLRLLVGIDAERGLSRDARARLAAARLPVAERVALEVVAV